MSRNSHVVLVAQLIAESDSAAVYRSIIDPTDTEDGVEVAIDNEYYTVFLAEDGYCDEWQISAAPAAVVVFCYVTSDYGELIPWEKLEARKNRLEAWCKEVCQKHHCSFKIGLTANYR